MYPAQLYRRVVESQWTKLSAQLFDLYGNQLSEVRTCCVGKSGPAFHSLLLGEYTQTAAGNSGPPMLGPSRPGGLPAMAHTSPACAQTSGALGGAG
jgi:hypothetical protein